jgi:hypothetical protein
MRHEAGANPRLFTFVGGNVGKWSVVATKAAIGDPLAATERLDVVDGPLPILPETAKGPCEGLPAT